MSGPMGTTPAGGFAVDVAAKLGPELAYGLFGASRTVRIHAMNNRATVAVLQRVLDTIRELGRADGRVTIAVVTDLLVVNDTRLVVDSQHVTPVLFVTEAMKLRRVEEIDIDTGVSLDELGRFLQVFFGEIEEGEDVFGGLSHRLAESGVTAVRLTEQIERVKTLRDTRINRKSIQEESTRVMSRAVLFVGEVMRAIEQKRPIQVSKAMRLTQKMADIIQVDESVLLGLTSIKDYDEYTFAHSVNVCVLSMAIADRLGLAKAETAEIGVAGLLHDIGKMHVPLSILNKSESLDSEEWETMKRHPMLGVIELSRVRSLRMITSPLFVTLQHHVQYAGGGYPQKPGAWTLHRHSRIVAVADVFDAMTTARNYRAQPLAPGKALRLIQSLAGRTFDPVVVRAFIQVMGVYPVGSGVELDTGDVAVVVRQNRELEHLHRPFVSIVNSPSREPLNLADQSDGRYRHSVVRSADELLSPAERAGCFIAD